MGVGFQEDAKLIESSALTMTTESEDGCPRCSLMDQF